MMSTYFAQIDSNNIVLDVHTVTPEFMAANPERYPGVWIETFIGDPTKVYAAIGFSWDGTNFIPAPSVIIPPVA